MIERDYKVNLYQSHIDFLKERSIDIEAATVNKLASVSAKAATNLVLGEDASTLPGDAIVIPYHNLDGSAMIGDDGIAYTRIRVNDQRTLPKGEKKKRYFGRPCSGVRPYLPAAIVQQISIAKLGYLVTTEGELKALSATANGIPCCGISGVTMWSSRSDTGISMTVDSEVHPEIIMLAQQAGGAIVVADSDATKNQTVQRTMQLFADALRKQAGVPVAYVHIPAPPESAGKEAKRGLDDWIHELNGNTNKIIKFLDYAFRKENDKTVVMASGGYDALGYIGQDNLVWSRARGCIVSLNANAVSHPATLINLVGGRDWCEAAYGKANKEGRIDIKWNTFSSDVIGECIKKGIFDMKNQRGAGIWRDSEGDLIVNAGANFWALNGKKVNRVSKDYVYPIARDLGISAATLPATVEQCLDVLDALKTWKWKKQSDAMVMFGWIVLGFLSGSLKWRPHISLTGSAQTGKSKLLQFTNRLLGPGALSRDSGTSEAGIRQEMGVDATVVILDETEADGKKVASLLTLLRSASDDKILSKGTTSGAAVHYTMRALGLISGIVPPVFNSADNTRFVCIELGAMTDDVTTNPHRLVDTSKNICNGYDETYEIGRGMCIRMAKNWDRFSKVQDVLRDKLDGSTRFRDNLSPILSAAWCMLNDGQEVITEEAADEFVATMDIKEQSERMTLSRDEMDAFGHLLSTQARVQMDIGTNVMTLAQLFVLAFGEAQSGTTVKTYANALGVLGMRVVVDADSFEKPILLIHHTSPGFRNLFRDTKWHLGNMQSVLKRVDGADKKQWLKNVRIGGCSIKPVAIDLSSYIDTHADELAEKRHLVAAIGGGASSNNNVSKYM